MQASIVEVLLCLILHQLVDGFILLGAILVASRRHIYRTCDHSILCLSSSLKRFEGVAKSF